MVEVMSGSKRNPELACDWCGDEVANGEGVTAGDDRVCSECWDESPNWLRWFKREGSMMAEVTSGSNLTVIVLNDYEAIALTELLDVAPPKLAVVLNELTNSMLTEKLAFAYDHAIEKGNNDEPF
jgi:hypothetical protein